MVRQEVVPGSLLSQVSAWASPETFVWTRLLDAMLSSADPAALAIHARVERWSLDEVPLPARLAHETLQWLYREDRLYRGTLPIRDGAAGPSGLRLPTLAVVNARDEIAPPASVLPFLETVPAENAGVLEISRRDRRWPAASRNPGRPSGVRADLARDHLLAKCSALSPTHRNGKPARKVTAHPARSFGGAVRVAAARQRVMLVAKPQLERQCGRGARSRVQAELLDARLTAR